MAGEERMVQEFRKSGKNQRVWCAEQGIKRSTLRYWLDRVEDLSIGREIQFYKVVTGGEKDAE